MRRNKLHIPHPVRRLRRTGVVRSVVPPFPTRIASLDSRGNPAPLQTPLKRPRKRRFLFLGTITPPNIGDGGIPYVKYSTGANKATCFVYRALGKPDWAAAQRAFLTGRAIGEWYAESKCLFRRVSAISRLQRLFFAYFFLTSQKKVCRRRHALCRAKKKGLKREISGLKTAYFLSKIAILPLCPTLSPNAAARSRTLI